MSIANKYKPQFIFTGSDDFEYKKTEFINCNKCTAEILQDMQNDREVIDACNNDKLGFKFIKKHSNKFNTDFCVVEFIDL